MFLTLSSQPLREALDVYHVSGLLRLLVKIIRHTEDYKYLVIIPLNIMHFQDSWQVDV